MLKRKYRGVQLILLETSELGNFFKIGTLLMRECTFEVLAEAISFSVVLPTPIRSRFHAIVPVLRHDFFAVNFLGYVFARSFRSISAATALSSSLSSLLLQPGGRKFK